MQQISTFLHDVSIFNFFFFSIVSGLVSPISINDVAERDADRRRAASEKLSGAIVDINEINRI